MEASATRRLIVTMVMAAILLQSGHVASISWEGNGTKVAMGDQFAELELMMDSEASRRILADGYYTDSSDGPNTAASCGRPYPTCGGPGTGAPIGENCDNNGFNRNCHRQNP